MHIFEQNELLKVDLTKRKIVLPTLSVLFCTKLIFVFNLNF